MDETSPLTWNTQEFEKKHRHPDWQWYVGLVFALGAVVSFFYGNIFFGILLIISGVVLIIYSRREPPFITVTIEEKGLRVNDSFIPHEKVLSFWLDETGKPDKLLLHVRGSFVPIVSLPLEGVSAQSVRERLKQKCPEVEIRESASERLFDKLGF